MIQRSVNPCCGAEKVVETSEIEFALVSEFGEETDGNRGEERKPEAGFRRDREGIC